MPTEPTPGRSLVTRRAIVDIVHMATIGCYGVTGFGGGLARHLLGAAGLTSPGIRVEVDGRSLSIELDLTVAYGLPVAEVTRQVDSAVRFAVRRALERDVDHLAIHVDGLRYQPGGPPPTAAVDDDRIRPRDLADSGTDVA